MATVKDFVRKPPSEAPGPAHPCDDPSLSATQFLYAIYHDPTFPLSVRINAAARLLPFTESVPTAMAPEPRCTIVIGGIPTEAQDHDNRNQQSFLCDRSCSSHPHDGHPGPSNIETNTDPPTLIDYSQPLTPTGIQEIKAAVHALQPNFDPSQPVPLYLCACGHWLTFRCNCVTVH